MDAIVDIIVNTIVNIIVNIIVDIIINSRAIVIVKIKYKNNKIKVTFSRRKGKIKYSKLYIGFRF